MQKIVIGAILISVVLLGIVYKYVGGIIGDDIVNQLSMAAAVIIIAVAVGVSLKYVNQMKNDKATGKLADENWDGIGEYKNNIPAGWGLSFLGTLAWFFYYLLFGWPVNQYSQIGEYNDEVKAYNSKFEETFKNISGNHEKLKEMGESIFLVQCAPCHGISGDGMDGKAANLTHRIDKEAVLYALNKGSNIGFYEGSEMPLFDWMEAGDQEAVASYVAGGMKGNEKGATVFADNCAACHGMEGEGMEYVAPALNKFNASIVAHVLEAGKKGAIGAMPKFTVESGRLNSVQQEALGAYITSLGE